MDPAFVFLTIAIRLLASWLIASFPFIHLQAS